VRATLSGCWQGRDALCCAARLSARREMKALVRSTDRQITSARRGRALFMVLRSWLHLVLGALAVSAVALPARAAPQEMRRHHALSLVGEPKFGPDFKHFDWVNPDAPKGGSIRQFALGTFDSLNGFTVKGMPASGLGLIYDALMVSSPDEPSTEYGLIAEWASYPADFSSVTFGLREAARFNDGTPVTPEDVIFSLEEMKKSHPHYGLYYKNVIAAEKTGPREVTFRFDMKGNRELPHILGQLPILPRHYWQAKGSNGEGRDLSKTTLEPPLGSGPYRIKSLEAGRAITYERVKDYWAKDLPVARGQWNYDELTFVYYRDRVPAFEAFKSGHLDFWRETSATAWATQYDFDAVRNGLIRKEALPLKTVAPMQAFVMNTRRKQFQDPRVRRAFNLAFNFEAANKNLFYGQYIRVDSYFGNTEMEATGLPQGRELEILNEVKDEVPPEVFTTEYKNPVAGSPMEHRKSLAEAMKLLEAAGWTPKDGVLTNAAGEQLSAEVLLVQPDFERVVLPYVDDLKKLGVRASIRVVDTSQYKRREDSFDFDVVIDTFQQSHSPGNEQRDFWGSAAADKDGSRNTAGIKNPAVDKLIEKIIAAKDREDLVAATRALDRVLLWNHYVVPQWHYPFDRLAFWDVFGRPDKLPSQATSVLQVWWFDPAKQKAMAAR
jgi:microcin C transport system substrate-binding protein